MIVSSRKEDHIRLAAEQQKNPAPRAYDDVSFIHHALDGVNRDRVSLDTQVGPLTFNAPFYVNGMTGGTETAMTINRNLAIAAASAGIAMASGSVGIALDYPETAASFTVIRDENPDGIVFANIGAGRSVADAKRAVDLLSADGLQLHVNAVQETIMLEGDRDFSTWLPLIEQIVAGLDVPVIIKEVGGGLSAKTLLALRDVGVQFVDVAGTGGTDFGKIENSRRDGGHDDYSFLHGYGNSAVQCLLDARSAGLIGGEAVDDFAILSSGGVRNPLDVVKSLALGARAVGVAGSFLTVALNEGPEAMTEVLEAWKSRLGEMLALMGVTAPSQMAYTDILIRGESRDFAEDRGIDLACLARRSQERK
ncbi:type 2 isopentenyl-diphosphate Delta-isomerase [Flaviflexus massiliensis]|uniref:type 2 isopentenyl-diphosphate Delta-isomerase n=1 Tax=Flaviflexus massiliensis TaxID=1522309 RepID=UPI000B0FA1F0|nr:type 2 isopentenyl-diphosphate Delta-isomerase [Flaviflexus massiliensis]